MKPNTQTTARQAGFLREGFRELGRKLDRNKLRNQSQKLDRERGEAAMRLGEQAWREKTGLEEFAALRDQLEGLEARAGDVNAAQAKLQEEKAALDARQRDETAKYDALRKEVEGRKRPVDEALAAARQRLNEQMRGAANLQARLGSLASQLSDIEKISSPGAAQDPGQLAQRESRKQQLAAEEKSAAEELAKANAVMPACVAEVSRIEAESRQLAGEIQKVESDRKAALEPILAELTRVAGETSAAQKEAGSVAEERRAALTQLGLALYEGKSSEPALAAGMAEIAAIDGRRASTQSTLEASLLLTRSIPQGTMLKFWSTIVVVPMLLIALVAGSFFAWSWWRYRPAENSRTLGALEQANPLLSQPLADRSPYRLADELAGAKSEQQVGDLMLSAFKTIGLGVYTTRGKQILAGSERSDKDFYLYNFEVHILAHAFFEHQITSADDESALLGAALLKLQKPESFAPVFKRVIVMTYAKALARPNDPSSFLILLVDGLARHQVKPYTLDQLAEPSGGDLYLDPLQSFLLMLDTFVSPPPNTSASWNGFPKFPWDEFGVVHADDDPCSNIKADKQAQFGEAKAIMGAALALGKNSGSLGTILNEEDEAYAAMEKGFGVAGAALQTFGAIHDLVWLYAVTIQVVATQGQQWLDYNNADEKDEEDFLAYVTYQLTNPPEDQDAIPCGPDAGQTIPQAPEPLPGVELMWTINPQTCLQLKEQTNAQSKFMTGESNVNVPGSLSGSLGLQTTTENGRDGPAGTSELLMDITCRDPAPPYGGTRSQDYTVVVHERKLTTTPDTLVPGGFGPAAIVAMAANLLPGGVEYAMGGKSASTTFKIKHDIHQPEPGAK